MDYFSRLVNCLGQVTAFQWITFGFALYGAILASVTMWWRLSRDRPRLTPRLGACTLGRERASGKLLVEAVLTVSNTGLVPSSVTDIVPTVKKAQATPQRTAQSDGPQSWYPRLPQLLDPQEMQDGTVFFLVDGLSEDTNADVQIALTVIDTRGRKYRVRSTAVHIEPEPPHQTRSRWRNVFADM